MSKKHKVLTGVAVVGMSGLLLTNTVFANDPPYIPNTPTEITITRINEAENKVWAVYNDNGLTTGAAGKVIEFGHIFWGGRSNLDEFLPAATIGNVYGSTNVYMSRPGQAGQTIRFLDGEEEEIVSKVGNLLNNDEKVLAYAFQTFDGDRIIGRADYSECARSSVYQVGMECRAEILTDGMVHYVAYDDGVRVYTPPIVQEVEVEVEVPVEVPVEVEKIVEVPKEVEKVVEVEKVLEIEVSKEVEVPVEVIREVSVPRTVEQIRTNFVPVETIKEVPIKQEEEKEEISTLDVEVPELGGSSVSSNDGWMMGVSALFGIGLGGVMAWFLPGVLKRKKSRFDEK